MPSTADRHTSSVSEPVCYFSLLPSSSSHFSVETPLSSPDLYDSPPTPTADPHNPLLALRPHSALCSPMDASRLMQFQTNAAHGASSTQNITIMQDVLHVDYEGSHLYSRSNSASSSSSVSSSTSSSTPSMATCSRCQTQGTVGFIRYAMNSYYCPRCARIVGYGG